jgi:hypothetical protein
MWGHNTLHVYYQEHNILKYLNFFQERERRFERMENGGDADAASCGGDWVQVGEAKAAA